MVRVSAPRLSLHNIHSIGRGVLLWFTALGSASLFNHLQPSDCFCFPGRTAKASERSTIYVSATHPATRNKNLDVRGGCCSVGNPSHNSMSLLIGFGMGRCRR